MANLSEGHLVGCGNPLLDIQAVVEKPFLDKWGLKENDAILCDDKHVPMFQELADNFQVEYVPGGATQNALRVCQWILNTPNRAVFFGSIGNDEYGKQLNAKATEAGVNARYQINGDKTGTCAALINGTHRSLCAHLAAANNFTIEHLLKPENDVIIKNAKFYYIAGFFLTVSPPSIMHVAKHSHETGKTFMFNLAAPFISQFFYEPLKEALPYIDVIFGNEDEAAAFAKASGFENQTDFKQIALSIAALPKESSKPRTVVITQGPDPVIVAVGKELFEFPINRLTKEQIVDTNGAGDAFVGGFLAQYIQGKSIEDSVKCGNYAASEIIQKHGCTVPSTCKYH